MIIDLSDQMNISTGLPPRHAVTYVNSSMPLVFVGIPAVRADGEITAVAVTVTNADAMPTTAPCVKEGDAWCVAFAPSCFPTYGFIERGYKVVATVKTPTGGTMSTTLAVGDVEIKADTPTATPGDPEKSYQIKGEDIFVKTRVIDDVQHYARQEMSYDAEMGAWGADWLGDYILVDGEFVPFQAAGGTAATVATALLALLLVPFSAFGITATKEYVDRKDGEIAQSATNYTDSAIAEIPAPDFSPSNATLVATIEETSPAPGDYATVSNKAMTALQSYTESDPTIKPWAKANTKPTYTASEVGALSSAGGTLLGNLTVESTGEKSEIRAEHGNEYISLQVKDNKATIKTSDYTYIMPNSDGTVALTKNIPNVPAWALAAQKPTYTADEVGAASPEAVSNIVSTAYVHKTLGVWMEYDEATGFYYYCHEEE